MMNAFLYSGIFKFSETSEYMVLIISNVILKGQCHVMEVEVRPWNGRLGLK
jgi:hypothetical protein